MPQTKAVWNVEAVGATAGQVWQVLQRSGKANFAALERQVDTPPALTHMAIGWLAREGKLQIAQEGRSCVVWLTEA